MAGELVPGTLSALRQGMRGRKPGVSVSAKFLELNAGKVCVSTYNKETGAFDRAYDFRTMTLSDGPVDIPAVTATVDAEARSVSFTSSADEQEDGAYRQPSDLVYGVVFDATLRRCSVVELGTRGDGGMKTFNIPSHWPATELYVYTFARKASPTVTLYPAG